MELDNEQKKVLGIALHEAARSGATYKETKALVEALLVESNIKNLPGGLDDSSGPLQQRPSQGWKHPRNVRLAVRDFLVYARRFRESGGSSGSLAQRVQRSGFPTRYGERAGEAAQLISQYGGGGVASSAPGMPGGANTSARTTTRTITEPIPGADSRVALAEYLMRNDPNNLLLRTGAISVDDPTERTRQVQVAAPTIPPTSSSSRQFAGAGHLVPTGRSGKVIGVPYQGTHTLGDWQSDNAIDISVPVGSPMVALQDGIVVKVRHHPQGPGRFAGDQITIRGKNGNEYFYAHGVANVKPGQRIKRGQTLGTTGSANGVPHLHFAQMKGDPRQHE